MQAQRVVGQAQQGFQLHVIEGREQLGQEEHQQGRRLAQAQAQVQQQGHGKDGLAGREEDLLELVRVQVDGGGAAGRHGVDTGDHAHQQGPLVELGGQQAAQGQTGVAAEGEHQGHDEFRRFGSDGRQPLHQQELVDAQDLAAGHQAFAEGFGVEQDHQGREQEQTGHGAHAGGTRELGQGGRRAFGLFFLTGTAGDDAHVAHIDAQEDHAVEQGQGALERDQQGIEGGHAQEEDVGALFFVQGHIIMEAAREDQHDGRPADTDEQPVGARHIGDGIMRVGAFGMLARHPGKVHVHGVFGQHGDEGHHGHGHSLGDVELGHFTGPGQQERRAQDGQAGQYGHQHGGNVRRGKAQGQARQGHEDSQKVGTQVAQRHDGLLGGVWVLHKKKDLGCMQSCGQGLTSRQGQRQHQT